MKSDDLEEQIEDLQTELSTIEDVFTDLKQTYEADQKKTAWDLPTKTQTALTATMILTMRVGGQFDPGQRSPDLPSIVNDLEACWRAAKDSAEASLRSISSLSVNLINLHEAKVVPWHRSASTLQDQLKKKLDSSQGALQREKAQFHSLDLQSTIAQKKLSSLQQKPPEAQQKYDDLNKWLWNSPETRLLQQSFKIVIESLEHEIESAKATAEAAVRSLEASKAAVSDGEEDVRKLASASKAQIDLLTQGVALLDKSTALLEEIKTKQTEISGTKSKRQAAWELAYHLYLQSKRGEPRLHKVDYAQSILQIVESSLGDDNLQMTLASIVKHLAENDDTERSVRNITKDGHPRSLLRLLEGQLGLPCDEAEEEDFKVIQKDIERQISTETLTGRMSVGGLSKQTSTETLPQQIPASEDDKDGSVDASEDDSGSEWDKVSVPFKPYGNFDRSSVRVSLNTKDTFPIERAGEAPCREKDGSPVFLASAIGRDGSKHPCKYVPSLQPNGCRVPYGGEELYHHGEYELLPYIPTLMEFVGAKNGQLPAGRRGVVGGHEERGQLYHAIGEIGGLWIPGKTGVHIGGATVPYGDTERHLRTYKILAQHSLFSLT